MQLLSYFSYYSMSWCNSLHHIMPMFPCVMILVSLLTRYPQFPQGYPQDNTICCTSIMQKIWNVAIFSITNGNKKWKYFPTTPKSSFFKKFFHSLPQSSCQIHLNHTGVCLWCFVKPPKGNTVCSFGGCHVWWTHTNTYVFVCTQVKPLSLKGFSCVVSTVHGVLVEAPYDNMIVVIGLSTANTYVFVVGCGHYQCNTLPWWVVCFPDSVSPCLVAW